VRCNFDSSKIFSTMDERKHELNPPFPFQLTWGPHPQQAGEPLLQVIHTQLGRQLPTKVDLRSNCSSVKGQGNTGACTAFSSCAALEYNRKVSGNLSMDPFFSERFLYYVERVNIDGMSPFADAGSFNDSAAKVCLQYGCCTDRTMPWSGGRLSEQPSQAAYTEAAQYKIAAAARIDDQQDRNMMLLDLRTALSAGMPMIGGFMCFDGIYSAQTMRTGVVPPPTGVIVGGHSVFFVGYDDINRMLIFKNSWLYTWGDGGYGYLPYDYVLQNYASDFWVLSNTPLSGQFGVRVSLGALNNNSGPPKPWGPSGPGSAVPPFRPPSPGHYRPPSPDPYRPRPGPAPYYPPYPPPQPYPYYPPQPPSRDCVIL
jgi:hypothetical protein